MLNDYKFFVLCLTIVFIIGLSWIGIYHVFSYERPTGYDYLVKECVFFSQSINDFTTCTNSIKVKPSEQ